MLQLDELFRDLQQELEMVCEGLRVANTSMTQAESILNKHDHSLHALINSSKQVRDGSTSTCRSEVYDPPTSTESMKSTATILQAAVEVPDA